MKSTKYFVLFNLLKSSGKKGASPAACAKEMGFAPNSVAPYIHALRNKFGAKIDSVREGRMVVKYVLTNADEVKLTQAGNKRGRKAKAVTVTTNTLKVKVKATKPVKVKKSAKKPVVADIEAPAVAPDSDLTVTEFSDRELLDLREQLGIA
jgi:hypothetical protein